MAGGSLLGWGLGVGGWRRISVAARRRDSLAYNEAMSYEGIITIEPGKRGGQPCVRGMRITVYDVLSYLASGMSEEQILADFPI